MIKQVEKFFIPACLLFFFVFRFKIASFRTGYELSFLYFVSVLFSYYLFRKNFKLEACFLMLCVLMSYYPACTLRSIHSLRLILIGLVCYYLLCKSDIELRLFLNSLCVYCMVHVAFLCLDSFGLEPYLIFGMTAESTGIGLTANPNEASALIALCTPAFMRKNWFYLIPALMVGLVMSGSFGGALAVILVFTWAAYRHNKRIVSLVLLLFLVAGFAIDNPVNHRLYMLVQAVNVWFDNNLVFGFGIGHFQYIAKKFALGSVDGLAYFHRAHNTFFHGWFELGHMFIILLVFYLAKLAKLVKNNNILQYAGIAVFVVCNVNSAFRINAINGLIIIAWISFMIKEGRNNEQSETHIQPTA